MGDGTQALFNRINDFIKKIKQYFNPIGQLYIQFQLLCRVFVCTVFLDDLFDAEELECDTQQTGCQQNCVNRYAPLNHKKIWEMEMFMFLFCSSVFLAFSYLNEHAYRRFEEKKKASTNKPLDSQHSVHRFKVTQKKEQTVVNSRIIRFGYIFMLVVRLASEIWFLYIENQLGKHQSQNALFWERLQLKESWSCPTSHDSEEVQNSLDQLIPPENRSDFFWNSQPNMACIQQSVSVTCWIPFSHMKSYGLMFMYTVLAMSTVMTCIELLYEIIRMCKCCGRKRTSEVPEYYSTISPVDEKKEMIA